MRPYILNLTATGYSIIQYYVKVQGFEQADMIQLVQAVLQCSSRSEHLGIGATKTEVGSAPLKSSRA
jgi:hypothetical protein